jgi:SAM-dependent methyltransferase
MNKFNQEKQAYITKNPRTKDYYPLVYKLIETKGYKSVLDVGCASGDFINLMKIDNVKCIGLDVQQELIAEAKSKSNNPNAKFLYGNILEDNFSIDMSIDCITCFGTAVTIENLGLLLERFISFKPKLIFINDFINVNGLDVVVGYRRQDFSDFNYPYNIKCKDTWKQLLKDFPDYSIEFEPYVMKAHLIKSDNPIRNFHSSIDGDTFQRNGMDLILRPHNILIKSKYF